MTDTPEIVLIKGEHGYHAALHMYTERYTVEHIASEENGDYTQLEIGQQIDALEVIRYAIVENEQLKKQLYTIKEGNEKTAEKMYAQKYAIERILERDDVSLQLSYDIMAVFD